MNLYSSIEETKDSNNKKFNDVKEQILIIQKTLDDEGQKREATHNEFMEFLKKMEEKIFDKFNTELQNKKDLESNVSQKLEERFNQVKVELQKESKTRYDHIENLEYYFERELPKIQEGFKQEQAEREENVKRIKLLETRSIELQDTVNNKSIVIVNLQKQIDKIDKALNEKTK